MSKPMKKGLGKGLGALISTEESLITNPDSSSNGIEEIDINQIEPNKNQPRKQFKEAALEELAASIEEFGIIQPLILNAQNGFYTIVAGERRWRAARMAKLKTVPAIIKNYDEMETLQIALIENIQREDLNPIEEALCYQKLSDIFFFRQEDIAKKVGKSRNTISITMSLLKLDPRVQNLIIEGQLTGGHGRKLLDIDDGNKQFELAEKIADEGYSILETEKLVAKAIQGEPIKRDAEKQPPLYKHIETDLMNILGTKVVIKNGKSKGKIEIEYYSPEELDRLTTIFKSLNN